MLTQEQITAFHTDGFLVLKNVFDQQEIQRYSEIGGSRTDENTLSINLCLVPELAGLCFDERILGVAQQLLNGESTYFFESNYVHYPSTTLANVKGHLHHDGKGSPEHLFNRLHHEFTQTYPVIRFGLYFQNTKDLSGGLKICPGSHLSDTSSFSDEQFKFYDVPTEPGDLICFCLRVLHSPFARRKKIEPTKAIAPWEEDRIIKRSPQAFLPLPDHRETIFIDYAGTDLLSDLHIKSRAMNPNNRKIGLADALLNPQINSLFARTDVKTRYDFAILDNLFAIRQHSTGGQLQESCFDYLKQLIQLCSVNREYSDYYTFTQSIDDGTYTLEDAVSLTNSMTQRFLSHSELFNSKDQDNHMGIGYSTN